MIWYGLRVGWVGNLVGFHIWLGWRFGSVGLGCRFGWAGQVILFGWRFCFDGNLDGLTYSWVGDLVAGD